MAFLLGILAALALFRALFRDFSREVCLLEIVKVVLLVNVVPQLQVSLSNCKSHQTFGRMARNRADMAPYAVHNHLHVFLFVGVVDRLKKRRPQLHHAGGAVSDKELTAAEGRL